MTHTGENVGGVALDLHPASPAVPLLPAPEFTVQELLVHLQSGGHAGQKGHERLPMRFSGSEVTQHEIWIVSDQAGKTPTWRQPAGVV